MPGDGKVIAVLRVCSPGKFLQVVPLSESPSCFIDKLGKKRAYLIVSPERNSRQTPNLTRVGLGRQELIALRAPP
jgi:hypothetical protein